MFLDVLLGLLILLLVALLIAIPIAPLCLIFYDVRNSTGRYPTALLIDHFRGIKEIDKTTRQDVHRGMEWKDFQVTVVQYAGKDWQGRDQYRLLGKRFRPATPQEDLRRIWNMKGW